MRYSVDSIKEGKAVLIEKGNEVFLEDLSALPEEVREGDFLEGDPQRGYRILPADTASKRKSLYRRLRDLTDK